MAQQGQHESLTPEKLLELIDPKNPTLLKDLGGAQGLAKKLNSDITSGLANNTKTLDKQENLFGTNILPEPISYSFLQFVWEALHDETLIVLMVAAFVEIAIGIYKITSKNDKLALIDGGAIVIASISTIFTRFLTFS